MSRAGKYVKFWGKNTLDNLGISLGAGLIMLLFVGVGYTKFSDTTVAETAGTLLSLYPYYMAMAGLFAVSMISISYYQTYFPILVSLNGTRKSVLLGVQASLLGTIAGLLFLSALIWKLVPGDISRDGFRLLPLLAGALLMGTGVTEALGAVIARWGRIGMFLLAGVFLILGAGCGILCAVFGDFSKGLQAINMLNAKFVLAAGGAGYLLSVGFVMAVTRKLEVRI